MGCKLPLPNEVSMEFSPLTIVFLSHTDSICLFSQLVIDILQHLDWKDLSSVADLCPRLQALAQAVFQSKWTNFQMMASSAEEAERGLRHFGAHIESLCLIPTNWLQLADFEKILHSLVKNCSDTLSSLEIHHFMFDCDQKIIDFCEPLFCHLRKLILKDCVMFIGWLEICSELTEFSLIRSSLIGDEVRANSQLSMLLTMKIEDMECTAVTKFDERNVALDRNDLLRMFDSIKREKCKRLPVTRFEIISNVFEFSKSAPIFKFENLKYLNIFTPVGYDNGHLIAALKHLKNLCCLYYRCIACKFTADFLVQLIGNTRKLHHLSIAFEQNMTLRLDKYAYRKFLNVVEQRSNHKPLHLIFKCQEMDFEAIHIPNHMESLLLISKEVI